MTQGCEKNNVFQSGTSCYRLQGSPLTLILPVVDTNHDGVLDFDEFEKMWASVGLHVKIMEAFGVLKIQLTWKLDLSFWPPETWIKI